MLLLTKLLFCKSSDGNATQIGLFGYGILTQLFINVSEIINYLISSAVK